MRRKKLLCNCYQSRISAQIKSLEMCSNSVILSERDSTWLQMVNTWSNEQVWEELVDERSVQSLRLSLEHMVSKISNLLPISRANSIWSTLTKYPTLTRCRCNLAGAINSHRWFRLETMVIWGQVRSYVRLLTQLKAHQSLPHRSTWGCARTLFALAQDQ